MRDLAAFQANFARAILDDCPLDSLSSQEAFAVYRNTCARGAVEALRAAYPTVDMLLSEEMFTQVALDYHRERPPSGPVLSEYGDEFVAFLVRQPWTCELPYLADVARLDRLWLESFLAPEPAVMLRPSSDVAGVALHSAARFAWLATPAMTIWQAHRNPHGFVELDPAWTDERALFTRSGHEVRAELIDSLYYRLLLACAASAPVAEVISAVAAAFPHADVPELLHRGVASGAIVIR